MTYTLKRFFFQQGATKSRIRMSELLTIYFETRIWPLCFAKNKNCNIGPTTNR